MIKKTVLLVCSALTSQAALANDSNVQSVIDAFTNCDNSFFHQLKINSDDVENFVDLIVEDNIAYIPVEDITSSEKNTYYFKSPLEYRGLNVTGYQNIYIETPFLGQYYYWGFIIDGSVESVKQSLQQLPWSQYNITSYIVNAQLYDQQAKNKSWQNNPYTIDGIIPRLFTIEKSLYLEPINENQVHLVCSMQGDMDSELLYSIRPDMISIDKEINAKREAIINEWKEKKQIQQATQSESEIEKPNDEKTGEDI